MSTSKSSTTPKASSSSKERPGMLYFSKDNYICMIGGLALIILGIILMIGGGSKDPNVYNEAELFSFRRITLAPILMMIGFAIEIVAIMRKPKDKVSE